MVIRICQGPASAIMLDHETDSISGTADSRQPGAISGYWCFKNTGAEILNGHDTKTPLFQYHHVRMIQKSVFLGNWVICPGKIAIYSVRGRSTFSDFSELDQCSWTIFQEPSMFTNNTDPLSVPSGFLSNFCP